MSENKAGLVICALVVLMLGIHLPGYFLVRQHRLSPEHLASGLLFESREQAMQWTIGYRAQKGPLPLMYGDSPVLYVFCCPAIQEDAGLTGRAIDSPFGVQTYCCPQTPDLLPAEDSEAELEE